MCNNIWSTKERVASRREEKVSSVTTTSASPPLIYYKKFSDITKIIWIISRLQRIARRKTLHGGSTESIAVKQLRDTENVVAKEVER